MRAVLPYLFLIASITAISLIQVETADAQNIEVTADFYGIANSHNATPFWLRTQREGMVTWEGTQTITRFQVHGSDNLFNLFDTPVGFDYGADLAGRYFSDDLVYFNQLYGRFTLGPLYLAGGRFTQTIGKTHETLTSGSMGISKNAVPIPRIQAGLSDYVTVPFTFDFIEIKGHIAHGWLESTRYVESPWLHEKSGYLRFGHNLSRFSAYAGLSHFGLWGGTSPEHGELPTGIKNYWRIFFIQPADPNDENVPSGWEAYMFGNSKGIWDFGAELKLQNTTLQLYRHIPIENRSSLKLNSAQDGLYGVSISKTNSNSIITDIAYEYLYTKWQNGPDGPGSRATGKAGWLNYYNSGVYLSGWTHHMQTIGSPLLTPYRGEIGSDTRYQIDNNRVVGHHVGISGFISEKIKYRTLFTYTRNYGTYRGRAQSENFRFEGGLEQFSTLLEVTRMNVLHPGVSVSAAFALDIGELYKNSTGLLLGLRYRL